MKNRPGISLFKWSEASVWTKLWTLWTVFGLLTAIALAAAIELNVSLPREVWLYWVVPGIVAGGVIELAALVNPVRHDTLSEHVWHMRGSEGGWSLALAVVAWLAWFIGTGDGWPSGAVFFLLWMLFHFAFEGEEGKG